MVAETFLGSTQESVSTKLDQIGITPIATCKAQYEQLKNLHRLNVFY